MSEDNIELTGSVISDKAEDKIVGKAWISGDNVELTGSMMYDKLEDEVIVGSP